jgi:3-isopropylmalate dehydrogenase
VANPIGAIASAAMLLRDGLGQPGAAAAVERAIGLALARGGRTRDIALTGEPAIGTRAMGDLILRFLPSDQEAGLDAPLALPAEPRSGPNLPLRL